MLTSTALFWNGDVRTSAGGTGFNPRAGGQPCRIACSLGCADDDAVVRSSGQPCGMVDHFELCHRLACIRDLPGYLVAGRPGIFLPPTPGTCLLKPSLDLKILGSTRFGRCRSEQLVSEQFHGARGLCEVLFSKARRQNTFPCQTSFSHPCSYLKRPLWSKQRGPEAVTKVTFKTPGLWPAAGIMGQKLAL